MGETAWPPQAADLVGVLIDARKGLEEERAHPSPSLKVPAEVPTSYKIDLSQEAPPALAEHANEKAKFEATFMISRSAASPTKRWALPNTSRRGPGSIRPTRCQTDPRVSSPPRSRAEKLFERLHQESPYHSTGTEVWKELRKGDIRIETIYVERESQPQDRVEGRGDIRRLAEAARREIAQIVEVQGALVPVRQGCAEGP